ncbi:MAG: hypothetical protein NUV67_04645 [archaeon]|nr:hypothetical protein [archaeon]
MISALPKGFFGLIKRPALLIPAIGAIIFNFAMLILAAESYFNVFYDTLILGQVPNVSLLEMPLYIFNSYLPDLLIIFMASLASLMLGFYLVNVYHAMIGEKKNAVPALFSGISRIGEIFYLSAFFAVALFLYLAAAFFLMVFSINFGAIGIVFFFAFLAWILLGLYAYLKLMYTPFFMAAKRLNIKKALAQSWKWSAGKFWAIFALLFLLWAITWAFNSIFAAIAEQITVEFITIAVLVLGLGVSNAYYYVSLTEYFLGAKE